MQQLTEPNRPNKLLLELLLFYRQFSKFIVFSFLWARM